MAKKRMNDEEWIYVLYAVLQGVYRALPADGRRDLVRALQDHADQQLSGKPAETVHDLVQVLQIRYPDDFRRAK